MAIDKNPIIKHGNDGLHLKYKLTGLPYKNVVQNFFIGSKYVYALQLHSSNGGYGKDAYISRTKKPAESSTYQTVDFTGAKVVHMRNFGHGQTLDFFKDGVNSYLLIATEADQTSTYPSKNNPNKFVKKYWDLQLARLNFNNPGTINTNTSVVRLAHIDKAVGMTGGLKRVGGAISKGNNYSELLVGAVDKQNNGYFARYDMDLINQQMDERSKTYLETIPQISSNLQPIPGLGSTALPQASIQGFELDNYGNIYVSSGTETPYYATPESSPSVTRFRPNNSCRSLVLNNSKWSEWCTGTHAIETEGIQLTSDLQTMFIGISYHKNWTDPDLDATKENRIYEFPMTFFN
ncbi:helveticin J family class III bacteriocin [Lactobacillus sp. ESL0681]|uniref:helveticin J family class III bacteriocin n=1 Tax=Lactobacillus sp. ESL0681 TaxID=2983211 RepID=UPI0023F8B0A5|nr:helveticin J family class III bacteriocin [Lactobacillus sp. ESL0681]WEV39606.1 helveticin J family class III bacteriocin [Lactobacillus sp. ESL0681]